MKFFAESLDTNTDEWRQASLGHPLSDLICRGDSVAVFLGVASRAVAVLKIDAKILNSLTAELFADAGKDRVRNVRRQIERPG